MVVQGSVGRTVPRSREAFCGSRAFSWRRPLLQRVLGRGMRWGECCVVFEECMFGMGIGGNSSLHVVCVLDAQMLFCVW